MRPLVRDFLGGGRPCVTRAVAPSPRGRIVLVVEPIKTKRNQRAWWPKGWR